MARSKRRSEPPDDPRRRIIDATEAVLRRHGPARTTVVDVARALGQSHASVYKHFADKAALLDAVVERWLAAVSAPLEAIAAADSPAGERLREWLLQLFREKVRKVRTDPEHFAMYHAVAEESHNVVSRHVEGLVGQIEAIITSGVAAREFRVADPHKAAQAVQDATSRFHHPALLATGQQLPTEPELEAVVDLLLAGLRGGVL
jgi:AcrR family transcriptional regulator